MQKKIELEMESGPKLTLTFNGKFFQIFVDFDSSNKSFKKWVPDFSTISLIKFWDSRQPERLGPNIETILISQHTKIDCQQKDCFRELK